MKTKDIEIKRPVYSMDWLKQRFKSFAYAIEGIMYFFKSGLHPKVHLAATVLVTALSIFFRVNSTELIALAFSISFVIVAEMINTAIEKAMDMITMEKHPQVKIIKDLAAAAVLVSACCAASTGLIVFLPKIFVL